MLKVSRVSRRVDGFFTNVVDVDLNVKPEFKISYDGIVFVLKI